MLAQTRLLTRPQIGRICLIAIPLEFRLRFSKRISRSCGWIVQSPWVSNTVRDTTTHMDHEVESTVWPEVRKVVLNKGETWSSFQCLSTPMRRLAGPVQLAMAPGGSHRRPDRRARHYPRDHGTCFLGHVEPGLYTSFAWAATCWLFSTCTDIIIGVCSYPTCRFSKIMPYQATLWNRTDYIIVLPRLSL